MSQTSFPVSPAPHTSITASRATTPPPPWAGETWAPAVDDEIQLRDVWRVLRRHRLFIAVVTAVTVGVGVIAVYRTTPVYEATAALRVDEPLPQIPGLGIGIGDAGTLLTEIETMRSRTLAGVLVDSFALRVAIDRPARAPHGAVVAAITAPPAAAGRYRLLRESGGGFKVIDRETGQFLATAFPGQPTQIGDAHLQLAASAASYPRIDLDVLPRDEAVDRFEDLLDVSRRHGDVNVVDVRFRSTDPQLSRDVSNALTASFMADRRNALRSQAHATAIFIRAQVARMAAQLDSAETALRRFQERERIVSIDQQAGAAVQNAAQLQAQRDAFAAESAALGALLARADTAPSAQARYRDLVAFPSLLRNPAVSGLLTSLAAVEDQRTALLTRRSPADPELQLLDARAREIESQLGAMARAYQQGLAGQAAALQHALTQSEGLMQAIPAREVELAQLRREAKVLEEIYSLMQTRLKEAEIGEAAEDPRVRLLDAAVLPREPVAPRPVTYVSLALTAGLVLGAVGAALREYSDRTVHGRRDVMRATGLPVLALIPRMTSSARQLAARVKTLRRFVAAEPTPRLLVRETRTPVSDAYDRLQVNLAFSHVHDPVRVVTISSAAPGDGKTTSAVNLATTLARRGHDVLLVDADLRGGTIGETLGVPQQPGLSELLSGQAKLADVVHRVTVSPGTTLNVMAGGRVPDDPAGLLAPDELRALFDRLRDRYETVVLDAPPVNLATDAALLGCVSDGVVLVVRSGVTAEDDLRDAVEHLRSVGARVLGVVLNAVDSERERGYGYAYGYRYGSYG